MRGRVSIAVLTLSLCVAGCDGGANDAAGTMVNEGANAVAPLETAAAVEDPNNALTIAPPPPMPGEAAAPETGPCPFEIRNLRATSGGPEAPDGGVAVEVEKRSADNRELRPEVRRTSAPPVLAYDLRSSPPVGNAGWTTAAFGIGPLPPTFTTVVLYCHGEEIARGPVRRAG